MIKWSEDYATGIQTVDDQHKMLILHINQLEELIKHPHPTPQAIEDGHALVKFLEQYADMHFGHEEDCMARHRCPAHALNQEQHQQSGTSSSNSAAASPPKVSAWRRSRSYTT
jgi:hemerythrin